MKRLINNYVIMNVYPLLEVEGASNKFDKMLKNLELSRSSLENIAFTRDGVNYALNHSNNFDKISNSTNID